MRQDTAQDHWVDLIAKRSRLVATEFDPVVEDFRVRVMLHALRCSNSIHFGAFLRSMTIPSEFHANWAACSSTEC
jgi:hypothetical protein